MNHKQLQQILASERKERRGGAPHEDWVSRNRDILLMQVRNTTVQKDRTPFLDRARSFVSVFAPAEQVLHTARTMAVFVLMIGTVFGGGLVSVMAYREAAPGGMVYQTKLAVEKAQVMLAPNDAYRVRLHATFADRRLDEAAKLAEGTVEEQKLTVAVLESFNEELVDLRSGLLGLQTLDPEGVAVAAKLLDRKMVAYQHVLKTVVRSLPSDIRPQALAVSERVEGLSLQAMAVLVEQYQAGDVNAPKNVVAHKIEDRILQAEAQLTVAAEKPDAEDGGKADQAKEAIAAAKELLKDENYQAAFSKMVEVVELTKEVKSESTEEEGVSAETETDESESASNSNNEEEGQNAEQNEETNEGETKDEENKSDPAADPATSADPVSEDVVGSGNR